MNNTCVGLATLSDDLTKVAATQKAMDGSTVAGYISADTGGFVDISGHNSTSFGSQPITDVGPRFNPRTNDLWWMRGDRILSAPTGVGGQPQDRGAGKVWTFTREGEPVPFSDYAESPDGSVRAVWEAGMGGGSWLSLSVGSPVALTAACLQTAASGWRKTEIPKACPSSAILTFPSGEARQCVHFLGFVSSTAFVCRVREDGGERYDRVDFAVQGQTATVTGQKQLTPPTRREILTTLVDPSGENLWFIERRLAERSFYLYVVPTATPTPDPKPTQVTWPLDSVSRLSSLRWRWGGKWVNAVGG